MPRNDRVKWKDFRSGMACHLLKTGWTRDEVNARLGHVPHSKAITAYINYLALDRSKPKQRMTQSSLQDSRHALLESRQREKLAASRAHQQAQANELLRAEVCQTRQDLAELRGQVQIMAARIEA